MDHIKDVFLFFLKFHIYFLEMRLAFDLVK